MNTKDVITAAIDATLAAESGDIEIADDMQKTSAWLVALATASIYFSFTQVQAMSRPVDRVLLCGHLTVIALLAISFLAAYHFRSTYTRFRALCRNIVVGRKILLAQLHEHADRIEKHITTAKVSLWVLVQSGQLSELFEPLGASTTADAVAKQSIARKRLDFWFRLQRRTSVLGLIAVLLVGAYSAYLKTAA